MLKPIGPMLLILMSVCLLEYAVVVADEYGEKPPNQASENYGKTDKFLPGEEVVTPTGKKMRVWSTEGPVPVSKAPEPFEDREETVIDDTDVLIDATELLENRHRKGEARDSATDSK